MVRNAAQKPKEGNGAAPQSAPEQSIDQVRDLLFGGQMRMVDARIQSAPAATLASAIGGSEMTPVVGLIDLEPGDSLMLCTDGLTKHVSNDRIAEVLGNSGNAEAMGKQLLSDALDAGGTDNVAVIVVRSIKS